MKFQSSSILHSNPDQSFYIAITTFSDRIVELCRQITTYVRLNIYSFSNCTMFILSLQIANFSFLFLVVFNSVYRILSSVLLHTQSSVQVLYDTNCHILVTLLLSFHIQLTNKVSDTLLHIFFIYVSRWTKIPHVYDNLMWILRNGFSEIILLI